MRGFIYASIAAFGGFLFGYDASVISGAISYVSKEFSLNYWQQGLLVSIPTIGALISMTFAGHMADRFGRKQLLLAVACLYALSGLLSSLASTYEFLVFARFIGGFAFASLMLAPLYIAEISTPEHRGKLVSISQLNIVIGFSAAYFSNYVLVEMQHDVNFEYSLWRYMFAIELLPAVLWLFLLTLLPSSPRWLMLMGSESKARATLHRLGVRHIEAAITSIRATLTKTPTSVRNTLSLLISPRYRFLLVIGLVIGITQQLTGINVIFFYAPIIFQQSGIGTDASFLQAVWVGSVNIVFTLIAIFSIDKFGRKPLLMLGLAGIVMSLAICVYGFSQAKYSISDTQVASIATQINVQQSQLKPLTNVEYDNDVDYKHALNNVLGEHISQQHEGYLLQQAAKLNAYLILFGIMSFVAFFAMSLGPVMWVLFAELFPNTLRGIAVSVLSVVNGLASFSVQFFFPWELANWGAATTFSTYLAIAVLGLLFVWRYLPETKGVELEEEKKGSE